MFKKSERLTKTEFSSVFPVGKRQHFSHLSFITQTCSGRKVAVVVGKKVAKSAARRNTIKRRVYAVLRELLTEHNFQGVMIVLVKPTFITLPRKTADKELRKSIAQVLKNA